MHNWKRMLGAVIASAAIMLVGWPAPPASAADVVVTGTVTTESGPCADGWAELYVWGPNSDEEDTPVWSGEAWTPLTAGAFTFTANSHVGKPATVVASCSGDYAEIWYGGLLGRPATATASNSKTLVEGTNDFGALTAPPMVSIAGVIKQSDGSTLPIYDRNGVLLPESNSTRREAVYTSGIIAWFELYTPGADPKVEDYVAKCGSDRIGVIDEECYAPQGTFDLIVYALGYDDRTDPTFHYPRTQAKVAGYVVPGTDVPDAVIKTAPGPAAVVKSPPKINGTPAVGHTVWANPGVWSDLGYSGPDLSFGYSWLVNGSEVGAGEQYTIAAADQDKSLVLRVSVSRALFATGTAESAPALVQLSGDTRLASVLTAKFSTLKHGQRGTVTVTVRAAGMGALGRVAVMEGSETLGAKTLVWRNNGNATFTFKAIRTKGDHTLTVTYFGNAWVEGSVITKVVKVK